MRLASSAILVASCGVDQQESEGLILTGARLVDGTGNPPIPDAALVIRGNRIQAAGPASRVAAPDGASVKHLQGCTILPGFINAHVHRAYEEDVLRAWVQGGVTTVRDLHAFRPVSSELFGIRDRLSARPECARIVAAGWFVNVEGGFPDAYWPGAPMITFRSVDEARQKATRLIDDGADVIKAILEYGTNWGRSNWPIPSLEALAAIVETAHQRLTPVSTHVTESRYLELALSAGVDDVNHMVTDELTDDLAERTARSGVFWVPTLELWRGAGYGLGDHVVDNLRRYVRTGGRIALGTDYAGTDNVEFDLGMPMTEIRWMREAGMSPMEIVVAATRHGAIVCGLGNEIGTLEPDKVADILVVEGNPLDDVEALRNVRMVIRDGVVVRS
jgi:imidazolonepropionase-like amidohydrolase